MAPGARWLIFLKAASAAERQEPIANSQGDIRDAAIALEAAGTYLRSLLLRLSVPQTQRVLKHWQQCPVTVAFALACRLFVGNGTWGASSGETFIHELHLVEKNYF